METKVRSPLELDTNPLSVDHSVTDPFVSGPRDMNEPLSDEVLTGWKPIDELFAHNNQYRQGDDE